MNELLLLLEVVVAFGGILLFWKFWGSNGVIAFMIIATIVANIEVTVLYKIFGVEMGGGTIFFASTFLGTDILSENCGKKTANTAANLTIATTILFIAIATTWRWYIPAPGDFIKPHLTTVFSFMGRLGVVSIIVFAICQKLDVYLYHLIWKKTGEGKNGLWIRNNVATLITQLVNGILFTFFGFVGIYPISTIIQIIIASYIITIFTSLIDTPFVYLSRTNKFLPKEV